MSRHTIEDSADLLRFWLWRQSHAQVVRRGLSFSRQRPFMPQQGIIHFRCLPERVSAAGMARTTQRRRASVAQAFHYDDIQLLLLQPALMMLSASFLYQPA